MCVRSCVDGTKMQTSRTWSKCLIWCAALLSPFQALQGTPILCHFVSSCRAANHACISQRACCHHQPNKLASSRTGRCKGDSYRLAVTDHSRSAPGNCPPNCWCRRPALPQSQPVQPVRAKVSTEFACVILDVDPSKADIQLRSHTGTPCMRPAAAAKQVCAVLCRFLT